MFLVNSNEVWMYPLVIAC